MYIDLLSVDEILLPRYFNRSTIFIGLLFNTRAEFLGQKLFDRHAKFEYFELLFHSWELVFEAFGTNNGSFSLQSNALSPNDILIILIIYFYSKFFSEKFTKLENVMQLLLSDFPQFYCWKLNCDKDSLESGRTTIYYFRFPLLSRKEFKRKKYS